MKTVENCRSNEYEIAVAYKIAEAVKLWKLFLMFYSKKSCYLRAGREGFPGLLGLTAP